MGLSFVSVFDFLAYIVWGEAAHVVSARLNIRLKHDSPGSGELRYKQSILAEVCYLQLAKTCRPRRLK